MILLELVVKPVHIYGLGEKKHSLPTTGAQCDHFQQFYNRHNVKAHVPIIRWLHCVELVVRLAHKYGLGEKKTSTAYLHIYVCYSYYNCYFLHLQQPYISQK